MKQKRKKRRRKWREGGLERGKEGTRLPQNTHNSLTFHAKGSMEPQYLPHAAPAAPHVVGRQKQGGREAGKEGEVGGNDGIEMECS